MEDKAIQIKEDQISPPSLSPSFNCYSSGGKIVEIAERVRREELFDSDFPEACFVELAELDELQGEDEDDDFEFFPLIADRDAPSSLFPIFNRDLLERIQDLEHEPRDSSADAASVMIPMRNLFLEDREDPPSSSSSEADELEGVSPETFCLWIPKKEVQSSPSRCTKSKSTGSLSKRWPRFRDLLRRSNSDGKDSPFRFFNHSNVSVNKKPEPSKLKGKQAEKLSAHEIYIRSKEAADRRRSYLPYRQGLVGLFANGNGFGRTHHPFIKH